MKISNFHYNLSIILENEKVLYEPSIYLGNNWKSILNFWFYLDNLSEDIKQKILEFDKYDVGNLQYIDSISHILSLQDDYIWDAVLMDSQDILNWYYGWATLEISCCEKILKKDLELKYLPLFIPNNSENNNFITVDYFSELCKSVEQFQLLLSTPTRVF